MTKVIKSKQEYEAALAEIEKLIGLDPEVGTPEADRLELLTFRVQDYERKIGGGEMNNKHCIDCKFRNEGECRRYPPLPIISTADGLQWLYPRPYARSEACGEFKPTEADDGESLTKEE